MKIANWKKFQHYKLRKPPWIRLYRELLEDPAWMNQTDAAKSVLCELWMVASDKEDGSLPDIEALAWRLRRTVSQVRLALSQINPKFLEDASEMLAGREQLATSETETETETEQRRGDARPERLPVPVPVPERDRVSDVEAQEIDERRKLRMDTERQLTGLLLEIRDSGADVQAVVDSLPSKAGTTPLSVRRWQACGNFSHIPDTSGGLALLSLWVDKMEARARALTTPHISDSNRETMENIQRVGDRMKAKAAEAGRLKEIRA